MSPIRRAARVTLAALIAAHSLACGNDDPVGNNGAIVVAVSLPTLAVEQGSTGSLTAAVTRTGGFSGAVTLGVSGLPDGVTSTITPAQLPGTMATATIDVDVAATVDPGTYTVTIAAIGQGVAEATTTWELTVTAVPNYTLTISPAAIAVAAGDQGEATVNIVRTNFTGEVALAVENPPAGIAGAFVPSPTTANGSTLTLTVAANVAPGNYQLTVRASAIITDRTAILHLTVTPSPTGGSNVEYQFCDPADLPAFLAYQDGSGPWQPVTGTPSGNMTRFTFNLTQGRGGVLMVFAIPSEAAARVFDSRRLTRTRATSARMARRVRLGGAPRTAALKSAQLEDSYETWLLYASTAELAQDGIDACVPTPPDKTVTGTVAGVPAGAYGIVSFGYDTKIFSGGISTNPVTFVVPPGPQDLVGSLVTTPGAAPGKIILFRNLDVPDGTTIPSTIDFNGPAVLAAATATVTIAGGAGDDLETYATLVTTNSHVGIWSDLAPSPNATRPWIGLPPAATQSGDLHGLFVFATPVNSNGEHRLAVKYAGPVTDQTITFGPPLVPPMISQVVAGAYPRFRLQGALAAEYHKGATFELFSEQGAGNYFIILATGAYLTTSGTPLAYDFTMPDVAGFAGFPVAARLTSGPNEVVARAFGFAGPGTWELTPSPGGESRSAVQVLTIDVP